MGKKKEKQYDQNLIDALLKLPNPLVDYKHLLFIFIDAGRARSNESRIEHIIKSSHDLKVRDIQSIPNGIINYLYFIKDPVYKNTFNYYIKRKGEDKGFIKVSIRLDDNRKGRAWIKTIYITYKIK